MPTCGRRKEISSNWLKAGLRRLVRDEEGALLIFSIQIFIVMLVTTGIAIDLVRQEERRSLIQNTLDRAALAAASLSQDLDPNDVVHDYLAKAGLGNLDVTPVVEQGDFLEWRRVTITANDRMPTIFGPLMGVNELSAGGNSQAEESVGNVEISLVLDISGSMGSKVWTGTTYSTRIALLRSAASNFVDLMFEKVQPATAPPGRLSISVVPYNQQVTLGTQLGSAFTLSTDHTQNTCADVMILPNTAIAISPSTTLLRTMYGDSYDYWGNSRSVQTTTSTENCPNDSYSTALPLSNDQGKLKEKIQSLVASGFTSIDFGARWGLALLDPAARPAVDTLIAKNAVSSDLRGRPFDYNSTATSRENSSMKVLVLMTDGDNTTAYSTKAEYRTGATNFVSTRSSTAFGTDSTNWNALYYYDPSRSKPYYSYRYDKWYYAYQMPANLYPITWETVWGKNYTLQYVIDKFLYNPMSDISYKNTKTSIYAAMALQSEPTQKDADVRALCTAAKEKSRDIVIFTVAVDAPPNGTQLLADCATSASYAYKVDAKDLTNAFASIATAINALRLTN